MRFFLQKFYSYQNAKSKINFEVLSSNIHQVSVGIFKCTAKIFHMNACLKICQCLASFSLTTVCKATVLRRLTVLTPLLPVWLLGKIRTLFHNGIKAFLPGLAGATLLKCPSYPNSHICFRPCQFTFLCHSSNKLMPCLLTLFGPTRDPDYTITLLNHHGGITVQKYD